MARATNTKKPPRNKDSSKFKDAVQASAKKDRGRAGVEHDETGPVFVEELTVEERAKAGELLGQKNIELRKLLLDHSAIRRLQNNKVKDLKKAIDKLSDEAFEGVRRTKAQKTLPGTEAP
jgi:hypothetical protein